MLTQEQCKELSAPLKAKFVKERLRAGRQLSYVEGWHVIAEANRIFGFDTWSSETFDIKCVSEAPRKIGKNADPGWGVSYVARVRIRVGDIVREGVGAGHGIDRDAGLAHESALKEAETDARKRAFMTFGNPFGLALYDKDQVNVVDDDANAADRISNGSGAKAVTEEADARTLTMDEEAKAEAIIAKMQECGTRIALADYVQSVRPLVEKFQPAIRAMLTRAKNACLSEFEEEVAS